MTDTEGTAPRVVEVNAVAETPNTYEIVLEDPIRPGVWTSVGPVVQRADGIPFEPLPCHKPIAIGFLPADADGDGKSGPVDILHLIDHLNGVYDPPMEIWQCDMNRSGVCGPADILRLIDLLNGANSSRPWLGVSLPPRP